MGALCGCQSMEVCARVCVASTHMHESARERLDCQSTLTHVPALHPIQRATARAMERQRTKNEKREKQSERDVVSHTSAPPELALYRLERHGSTISGNSQKVIKKTFGLDCSGND